ncbi:Trypsin CFT-1 [Eumeta japonica]|uniref:Trypsin CFT-1 n=1 Tax=Eumeta variegata TaxID=151549 RepID=A0A4C1WHF6_EUMVA|nr:Trypsin CFT-1 [Eumeta japonica]
MQAKHMFTVLIACLCAAVHSESVDTRIVGGSLTTINAYPFGVSVLAGWDLVNYWQSCGGTILTTTAVLCAAHCFDANQVARYRVRVGSTFANSGGTVHNLRLIINHPNYNTWNFDNDISVLRTQTAITYIAGTVAPASIAGSNYNLADNQVVWAIGWGRTSTNGPVSEQLRHVQIWTINQNTCRSRYAERGWAITDNMLCSGWLDVGGRDQCSQDSGGRSCTTTWSGVCSFGIVRTPLPGRQRSSLPVHRVASA